VPVPFQARHFPDTVRFLTSSVFRHRCHFLSSVLIWSQASVRKYLQGEWPRFRIDVEAPDTRRQVSPAYPE
jgi:hypothetical protein